MISKNDFIKMRTTGRKKVEKIIDEALMDSARHGSHGIKIAVSLLASDAGTIEEVLADYRCAGWHCARVSDYRDGDYLEFMTDK